MKRNPEYEALVAGSHNNPFAVLGPHVGPDGRFVRTLQPDAASVELLDGAGKKLADMTKIHAGGLFEGAMPARKRRYALRVTYASGDSMVVRGSLIDSRHHWARWTSTCWVKDPIATSTGSSERTPGNLQGVSGTRFAVWAPSASRVSLVGDFNQWDGRRHVMRLHPGNGIWEIFAPAVGNGTLYKYEIQDTDGNLLPLKSDPYATYHEPPPGNSSIVFDSSYDWQDSKWQGGPYGRA